MLVLIIGERKRANLVVRSSGFFYLLYDMLSARQLCPPGSWHAAVSARAILVYFQVAPSNEEWEEVQPRSVTEDCSACRQMEERYLAG